MSLETGTGAEVKGIGALGPSSERAAAGTSFRTGKAEASSGATGFRVTTRAATESQTASKASASYDGRANDATGGGPKRTRLRRKQAERSKGPSLGCG